MVCDPCHRMDELRDGLRAQLDDKRGMLAHVVEGGEIALGDPIELWKPRRRATARAGVAPTPLRRRHTKIMSSSPP